VSGEQSIEEAVIARAVQLAGLPSARAPIGAGDDMALVRVGSAKVLIAVDQVVEGVHFRPNTPLDLVARKAIARNVSDIAAMGALPAACVAAATLPSEMPLEDARVLVDAVAHWAHFFDCPLVGGDTAVHRSAGGPLTLSVTVMASVRSDGVITRRSGAGAGDVLLLGGAVGGSFGADGLGRHLHIEPRVAQAQQLIDALGAKVHAMIDVSDGLGRDAARLAHASGARTGRTLQARLHGDRIPLRSGATLRQGLCDGEDHELLAAVDSAVPIPAGWTAIGSLVTPQPGDTRGCVVDAAGVEQDASDLGWTHG
jgi:thiamine-monophosphate kinase